MKHYSLFIMMKDYYEESFYLIQSFIIDDVKDISKDKLKCTVCAKSIADAVRKGIHPFVHTVLGVLMCKVSSRFVINMI